MTFADCGLDIEKNFLSAPLCDCGCGGRLRPILRTKEDIIDICGELVSDNDCMQCGVFAITRWNTIIGAINMDETVRTFQINAKPLGKSLKSWFALLWIIDLCWR